MKQIRIETLGLGMVRLNAAPEPAGTATIPLSAGVVVVNPTRSGELGYVTTDIAEAEQEIRDLYGNPAWEIVERLAEAEDGSGEVVGWEPDDEEVAGQLVRVGTVRWLQANSPLPLDRRLLRLEELTALVGLGERVAEETDPLVERTEELADLCRYFHDHLPAVADFPPALGLLAEALEQVAAHAPAPSGIGEWALERLNLLPEVGGEWREALVEAGSEFALAADGQFYSGIASINGMTLPRNWISTARANASWQAEIDQELRVDVAVAGPDPVNWLGGEAWEGEVAGPEVTSRLGFDLTVDSWPIALVVGELAFDPASNQWHGMATGGSAQAELLERHLDAGEEARLRVWQHAPTVGAGYHEEEGYRWAAQGISSLRLLSAVAPKSRDALVASAAESFELATKHWQAIKTNAKTKECDNFFRLAQENPHNITLTIAEKWLLSDFVHFL